MSGSEGLEAGGSGYHEAYVSVGDVRLHYLDWGGSGLPLVLLSGLGHTAHIFEELAPLLTSHFHVYALTRRGHGASSVPASGFDPQTLANDAAAFLEVLELERVTLVGHSVAGNELTVLGTLEPGRFAHFVYLDAAYDRSGTLGRMRVDPAIELPPLERPTTLDGFRERGQETMGFWNSALESDLRARLREREGGELIGTPPHVPRSIVEESDAFLPSYRFSIPTLAIYSMFEDEHWLARANQELGSARVRSFMREVMIPWQLDSIEQFASEAKNGEVIKLPGAHHYNFFSHREWLLGRLIELARD